MSQLGRIGGGVLVSNLERQGVNLSFKNQIADVPLLFLEVSDLNLVNHQIGINTDILPSGRDLTVALKIRTEDLISDILSVPNYVIDNNKIEVDSGNILLNSTDIIQASGITTDDLKIQNNAISSFDNKNINIKPSGTEVNIHSDLIVKKNLYNTENITIEGSIIFGDSSTDSITFDSKISSDLIPSNNNKEIGSQADTWENLFNNDTFANTLLVENLITSTTAEVNQITFNENNIFINDETSDLNLNTSVNNLVRIDNVNYFEDNFIKNNSASELLLVTAENGYVKFDNTFGLVLPTINTSSRPLTPQIGETIYNSESEVVEIWNGFEWLPSSGIPISSEEFDDITNEWALILG
jgi:hypothetical protein